MQAIHPERRREAPESKGPPILVVLLCASALALAACRNDTTNTRGGAADAEAMGGVGASTSKQPEGQPAGGAVEETPPAKADPEVLLSNAFGPADGGAPAFGPGGPGAPGGSTRPLLPPAKMGDSISRLEGCLAAAASSESDGAQFPARGATRSAPAPILAIPTGGGALVEHTFDHACCLKGAATAAVEGATVTITETLTGTPCRCRCSSKVTTAVALEPGTYTVKVQTGEGANTKQIGETTVTVR